MANNKKHSNFAGKKAKKCKFQEAVENTNEVRDGFRVGKGAINSADRNKIEADNNNKIQGSLDIDSQVKALYPEAPRWDYVLSYDDKLYYFEIHPAETSEVDRVIKKLCWLKNWLRTKAEQIDKLPKAEHPYIWVQSGRYAILSSANMNRKLSAVGISIASKLKLK